MKKTILALAVLSAGSANAAINAYDKDGVKVDVSAAVEVQAFKSVVNTDSKGKYYNEDLKLRLDDGDLALNVTAEINEELSAIATTGFKYEAKKVENDDLFVGLQHTNFGTATIGRQTTLVDDSGISKDIEFGLGFTDSKGESKDLFLVTSGDEVVKYKLEKNNYWFGASYAQANDASEEAKNLKSNAIDLGAGVTVGNATFTAYIQDAESKTTDSKVTQKTYQLEASYKLDSIEVATSYSDSELNGLDINAVKLTAAYTVENTTFAIGSDFGQVKAASVTVKQNNYYVNVTNKLTDNVKVYGELGYVDADKLVESVVKADGANIELGYVAGLEIKF